MSNEWAELLSRKQAAEYLNTTPGTLNYWASTGKHNLPYYRMGTKAVYKRALTAFEKDLEAVETPLALALPAFFLKRKP